MRADGQMDTQTDVTKLIVNSRNFANAPSAMVVYIWPGVKDLQILNLDPMQVGVKGRLNEGNCSAPIPTLAKHTRTHTRTRTHAHAHAPFRRKSP